MYCHRVNAHCKNSRESSHVAEIGPGDGILFKSSSFLQALCSLARSRSFPLHVWPGAFYQCLSLLLWACIRFPLFSSSCQTSDPLMLNYAVADIVGVYLAVGFFGEFANYGIPHSASELYRCPQPSRSQITLTLDTSRTSFTFNGRSLLSSPLRSFALISFDVSSARDGQEHIRCSSVFACASSCSDEAHLSS